MSTPKPRLWLCLVEHKVVPGTVPLLFHSPVEPIDKAVKARVRHAAGAREVHVVGKFDLSHVVTHDPESKRAIAAFIADGGMNA